MLHERFVLSGGELLAVARRDVEQVVHRHRLALRANERALDVQAEAADRRGQRRQLYHAVETLAPHQGGVLIPRVFHRDLRWERGGGVVPTPLSLPRLRRRRVGVVEDRARHAVGLSRVGLTRREGRAAPKRSSLHHLLLALLTPTPSARASRNTPGGHLVMRRAALERRTRAGPHRTNLRDGQREYVSYVHDVRKQRDERARARAEHATTDRASGWVFCFFFWKGRKLDRAKTGCVWRMSEPKRKEKTGADRLLQDAPVGFQPPAAARLPPASLCAPTAPPQVLKFLPTEEKERRAR